MISFSLIVIVISVSFVLVLSQTNATGKDEYDPLLPNKEIQTTNNNYWPNTECKQCLDFMDYQYRFGLHEDGLDFETFVLRYKDEMMNDHLFGHYRDLNDQDIRKDIADSSIIDSNAVASSSYRSHSNPCGCCTPAVAHCCADYLTEICVETLTQTLAMSCFEFIMCLCKCAPP